MPHAAATADAVNHGDCEQPRSRTSGPTSASAAAEAAHGAERDGRRHSCSQWENNEGADFPGRPARDNSDDEDGDEEGAWQEALYEAWESLDPDVRSRKALIPTLSGESLLSGTVPARLKPLNSCTQSPPRYVLWSSCI